MWDYLAKTEHPTTKKPYLETGLSDEKKLEITGSKSGAKYEPNMDIFPLMVNGFKCIAKDLCKAYPESGTKFTLELSHNLDSGLKNDRKISLSSQGHKELMF